MMTSKKRTLIGLGALLAIAATQACGSDDPAGGGGAGAPAAAGAGGAHAGASGVSGGGATAAGGSGGAAAGAGAPAGGSGGAAAGAGGAAAGAGGASGGAGGAAAGAGGAAAGAGGAGGPSPTFTAVKTLIGMSCGTGNCHNMNSGQLNFQTTTDLYAMLTTPIPANGVEHCNGSTLAVANDTSSLLLRITSTAGTTTMCTEKGGMATIARMPDNCKTNGNPMCLSATQHKVFEDWIAAGAPK